jgi:SagB-type dehydrogenase family enzyme
MAPGAALVPIILIALSLGSDGPAMSEQGDVVPIVLPEPDLVSEPSLEEILGKRRSTRDFSEESLTLKEISQLLWAAQGTTSPDDRRTAPSAGALYPLEIVLVAGNVDGLAQGIYRYRPRKHDLLVVSKGDAREKLSAAALNQRWLSSAPAVVAIAAVFERTAGKYGDRAPRYVHMEAGCAAQNLYLQATAMGLGTVFVGAFHDEQVRKALALAQEERPLGLMPVGKRD